MEKGSSTGRIPVASAMWVMGFTFVIAQVLAVREFLILFQGNELSIGIILGNWLLFEALGSYLAGRRADRSGDPVRSFAGLQALASLLLPLTVLAIRLSRPLFGISPWESMSPLQVWGISALVLAPLGLCDGAEFSYGCRAFARFLREKTRAAGKVYILEAVGSVFGGFVFTYLLVGRVHVFSIALMVGLLNGVSASVLLFARPAGEASPGRAGVRKAFGLAVLIAITFLLLSPAGDRLQFQASQMRWKGLDLTDSADSVYGNISVFKQGEQFTFFQNGIPAITVPFPDTTAVEEFVHLSLLAHPDPKSVLFLGGGLGGALAEALKHPVEALFYTEMDPLVIRMVEKYSTPLTESELGDPRILVRQVDGRRFAQSTGQRFDAVLVHVPDATTLLLNRFFTREFFESIQRRLLPAGILAMTLPGSTSYMGEEAILLNRCVLDTLRQVFSHTRIIPGERNLLLASKETHLENLSPDTLADRMVGRNLSASVVSPYYLGYKMDPDKAAWMAGELAKAKDVRINRDFSPALLHYFLTYRNAQIHPEWRDRVLELGRIGFRAFCLALVVFCAPFMVWFAARKGRRNAALGFAVFSTGFVGMTMEIVLILSFQALYGHIYHWVGILVSSFMGGLALGAFLINRRTDDETGQDFRTFLNLETGIVFLVAIACIGFWLLPSWNVQGPWGSGLLRALFAGFSVMSGLLVGCEFPLANREILKQRGDLSRVAGRLYGLDLAGAWLGTMLVSTLLVPLIGILHTLFLIVLLKLVSLACLRLARA